MDWEVLYSVLKMTREGKDNMPLENEWYIEKIKSELSMEDIEKMKAVEIKEAVITYLQVLIPGIK